jgi:hypothetical protein
MYSVSVLARDLITTAFGLAQHGKLTLDSVVFRLNQIIVMLLSYACLTIVAVYALEFAILWKTLGSIEELLALRPFGRMFKWRPRTKTGPPGLTTDTDTYFTRVCAFIAFLRKRNWTTWPVPIHHRTGILGLATVLQPTLCRILLRKRTRLMLKPGRNLPGITVTSRLMGSLWRAGVLLWIGSEGFSEGKG